MKSVTRFNRWMEKFRESNGIEQVNNIIGDKIQQYAEGLIQKDEKRKSGLGILDMFSSKK